MTGTNNRLLEDPKYRYDYDLVGNRTKRTDKATSEVTEYAWDIRDRLTSFTLKNAGGAIIKSAQYKYDVFDQRISKTVDPDGAGVLAATTERYVYGSNQNIALEFDGSNNLTHRYLFGDGIDQIEADESNGTVLWGLVDHLGSVRDVVDNSGTVRKHISYDSFGNITAQTDSTVVFRYGYTGREFDKESDQYYYRSRPLDPFTGRFIQEDKIGFAGGDINLNRYVFNSPSNFIDPFGEFVAAPAIPFIYKAVLAVATFVGATALLDNALNKQNPNNSINPQAVKKPKITPPSQPNTTITPRYSLPQPLPFRVPNQQNYYPTCLDDDKGGSTYMNIQFQSELLKKGENTIQRPRYNRPRDANPPGTGVRVGQMIDAMQEVYIANIVERKIPRSENDTLLNAMAKMTSYMYSRVGSGTSKGETYVRTIQWDEGTTKFFTGSRSQGKDFRIDLNNDGKEGNLSFQ